MHPMVGNWEMTGVSEPRRYFDYADAYLQASICVCLRMKDYADQRTWPNACVSLMLAAHSVELFLKGALLARGHKEAWGHTLIALEESYRGVYRESRFNFECPFRTEYCGLSDEEIRALEKPETQHSVQFRYPVRKPGVEWEGIQAFEPVSFLALLSSLNNDYSRLVAEFGDV